MGELCDAADDELLNKTVSLPNHVLHALLPPPSTASQNYNLRHRTHSLQLPAHTTLLADSTFITRMLYKDTYLWRRVWAIWPTTDVFTRDWNPTGVRPVAGPALKSSDLTKHRRVHTGETHLICVMSVVMRSVRQATCADTSTSSTTTSTDSPDNTTGTELVNERTPDNCKLVPDD